MKQSSVITIVSFFTHTQSAAQRTAHRRLNDIFSGKYLQVASQCADALSDRRQKLRQEKIRFFFFFSCCCAENSLPIIFIDTEITGECIYGVFVR